MQCLLIANIGQSIAWIATTLPLNLGTCITIGIDVICLHLMRRCYSLSQTIRYVLYQWWLACIQHSRPRPHHIVRDPKWNEISWWTALHTLQMAFLFWCHWHQCERREVSKGCTCYCSCDFMHALLAIYPSQHSSCLKFCEILACIRNSQLLVLIRKCNSCITKLAAPL